MLRPYKEKWMQAPDLLGGLFHSMRRCASRESNSC